MKLRVILDNGDPITIERDDYQDFVTWCTILCHEGFTNGDTYFPGSRVRKVELVGDDDA